MTLMPKRILVTGGAGFIGSAVAREIVHATPHEVVVLDKLTYAGNLDNPRARGKGILASASCEATSSTRARCARSCAAFGRT